MTRRLWFCLALPLCAQPVITDAFPPQEYAERRAKVMQKLGEGIAILQGATERAGEQPFRQATQFAYLTGVVEPRAILVMDGTSRRSTLFLYPKNERWERSMYGPGLSPGEEAARATGIEMVLARGDFQATVEGVAKGKRTIYTPFRPEVLESASAEGPVALAKANKADPWDGRATREEIFRAKLQAATLGTKFEDLDPLLDVMRATKSPREIAVIREATRIAGLGIMEAMRDARPGLKEYELQADAEYVFKKYGAFGAAYFALVATGPNTYYSHYHKGTETLREGDLVQFDYAPDFKNYQSDVTRVFPANGKFTPWQREYYSIYLQLYQALMTSIKVHATPRDVMKEAVVKMDAIMAGFAFTDPKIQAASKIFVNRFRNSKGNSLGHGVGMEVHDVRNPNETLEPGYIFTIEPAMRIEELHLGLRLEDMILITDKGYENLSAFVPIEITDIEKAMASGDSLSAEHQRLLKQSSPK